MLKNYVHDLSAINKQNIEIFLYSELFMNIRFRNFDSVKIKIYYFYGYII